MTIASSPPPAQLAHQPLRRLFGRSTAWEGVFFSEHDKLRIEAAKQKTSIKSLIIRAAREWLARANKRTKRKK